MPPPPTPPGRPPHVRARPPRRLVHSAWPVRVAWLALPLVAGPALSDALAEASRPVQLVASIGVWGAWAAALVATLVPTTVSLTALRLAAPSAVAAALVALVADGAGAATVGGPGGGVGGRADRPRARDGRGVRRRLVLRRRAAAAPAHPRRPAARGRSSWRGRPWRPAWPRARCCSRPGSGWPGRWPSLVGVRWRPWWGVRVMHTLARRWLVFVPTGIVIHDPLTLLDPILVRRSQVRVVRPRARRLRGARPDGRAPPGLALELRLTEPLELLPVGAAARDPRSWSRRRRARHAGRPGPGGGRGPPPPVGSAWAPLRRPWWRRTRRAPCRRGAR